MICVVSFLNSVKNKHFLILCLFYLSNQFLTENAESNRYWHVYCQIMFRELESISSCMSFVSGNMYCLFTIGESKGFAMLFDLTFFIFYINVQVFSSCLVTVYIQCALGSATSRYVFHPALLFPNCEVIRTFTWNLLKEPQRRKLCFFLDERG